MQFTAAARQTCALLPVSRAHGLVVPLESRCACALTQVGLRHGPPHPVQECDRRLSHSLKVWNALGPSLVKPRCWLARARSAMTCFAAAQDSAQRRRLQNSLRASRLRQRSRTNSYNHLD